MELGSPEMPAGRELAGLGLAHTQQASGPAVPRQPVQLLKIKVTSTRNIGWPRGRAYSRQMGGGEEGTQTLTHHQGNPPALCLGG